VRRALASLLLVLFSFPLIEPAIVSDAPSQLPACCKRNGAHHCDMSSGDAETQGSAIQAIRPKCPYYPATAVFPVEGKAAVLVNSRFIAASVSSYPAVAAVIQTGYHPALSRSHHKRGPPSQLS
jgi:hypothetical protein